MNLFILIFLFWYLFIFFCFFFKKFREVILFYTIIGFFCALILLFKCSNFLNIGLNFSLMYSITFFPDYFILTFNCEPLGLLFVILSFILVFVSILYSWHLKYKNAFFFYLLLILLWLFVNIFLVADFFFFFFFFEIILLPMFLLIGVWGTRERKLYAAFQLFFFTIVGSVFFLIGFFLIYMHFGSSNFLILTTLSLSESRKMFSWFCLFVTIAIKVPMFPLHLWLPEAHVEASTIGSVLLAGIILKLGLYILFKIVFVLFPLISLKFSPLISVFALISVLYASFVAIVQIDLKRAIAYSSIAHMNMVLLGFFSFDIDAVLGSILMMLSHGFVSSALFIMVGFIYERYKTRNIIYYGGVFRVNPKLAFFFIFFSLANMGFPGTFSYIAETQIFLGLMNFNSFIAFLAALSIILSSLSVLILLVRVFYGLYKSELVNFYGDLTLRELFILFILFIFVLIFGFSTDFLIDIMLGQVSYILFII